MNDRNVNPQRPFSCFFLDSLLKYQAKKAWKTYLQRPAFALYQQIFRCSVSGQMEVYLEFNFNFLSFKEPLKFSWRDHGS